MDSINPAVLIAEYGFTTVAIVGLGYFVYFVWQFVNKELDPKIEEMHLSLIKLIDQVRMLDQDMIRLQEKIKVVLEYRERQELLKENEEREL
tara:strand:- start:530 stop:805 length:276 start_codon:yes stop_codon:yes gene_type:complete